MHKRGASLRVIANPFSPASCILLRCFLKRGCHILLSERSEPKNVCRDGKARQYNLN